MFGKRTSPLSVVPPSAPPLKSAEAKPALQAVPSPAPESKDKAPGKAEAKPAAKKAGLEARLEEIKGKVFSDLIETVDLGELSKMSMQAVREELSDIIAEIMSMRNFTLSAVEQESVVTEICNDVLGLGPLEPLIARDDIANLRPLTRSLMPEGLEDLGDAALADLIEFLLDDAKQPVR